MIELIGPMDQFLREHVQQLSMAIIATLLVLFGNDINSAIKALIRRYHFVIRTIAFILICAFGYGLLTVWLTPLLAKALAKLSIQWFIPMVVLVFLSLGIYAQKQKHI